MNRITGCHGNHALSRSTNRFILENVVSRILGIPGNKMTPMKNCPVEGVQGRSYLIPGYIKENR